MGFVIINGFPVGIWPEPKITRMQDMAEDVEYEIIEEPLNTNQDEKVKRND